MHCYPRIIVLQGTLLVSSLTHCLSVINIVLLLVFAIKHSSYSTEAKVTLSLMFVERFSFVLVSKVVVGVLKIKFLVMKFVFQFDRVLKLSLQNEMVYAYGSL